MDHNKNRLISFLKKQKEEKYKFLLLNINKINKKDLNILYSLLISKDKINIEKIQEEKIQEISELSSEFKILLWKSKKLFSNYEELRENKEEQEKNETLLSNLD